MNGFGIEVVLIVIGVVFTYMLSSLVSTFKEIKIDATKTSSTMNEINLKLGILMSKHDAIEELAKANTAQIANNAVQISKNRDRLHYLEGQTAQVLQFIEDYAKNR